MDRDQVEAEVRARRQTPAWAERQAEANGWEPFAPVQMPWWFFDGGGLWPINFATMWLSCETPELAAVNWNRLRFWGRHVWRDVPDGFHAEQARLNEALQKGTLIGWGKAQVAWTEIPQCHWQDFMFWETDQDFASASIDGQTVLWHDVRVQRVDVEALRPGNMVCDRQSDALRVWPGGPTVLVESALDGEAAAVAGQDQSASRRWERIATAAPKITPGTRLEARDKNRRLLGRPFKEALEAEVGFPVTVAESGKAFKLYAPESRSGRPPRNAMA